MWHCIVLRFPQVDTTLFPHRYKLAAESPKSIPLLHNGDDSMKRIRFAVHGTVPVPTTLKRNTTVYLDTVTGHEGIVDGWGLGQLVHTNTDAHSISLTQAILGRASGAVGRRTLPKSRSLGASSGPQLPKHVTISDGGEYAILPSPIARVDKPIPVVVTDTFGTCLAGRNSTRSKDINHGRDSAPNLVPMDSVVYVTCHLSLSKAPIDGIGWSRI